VSVEIIPGHCGDVSVGETSFGHGGRLHDDDPFDVATVAIAGYVAEQIFDRRSDRTAIVTRVLGPYLSDDDAFQIKRLMLRADMDDDAQRRFVEAAAERAERILRSAWSEVELLAAALVERLQLDGPAVEAILSQNPLGPIAGA